MAPVRHPLQKAVETEAGRAAHLFLTPGPGSTAVADHLEHLARPAPATQLAGMPDSYGRQGNQILEETGGIPQFVCAMIERNKDRTDHLALGRLEAGNEVIDPASVLPASPHRELLGLIESVDDLDSYRTILELAEDIGIRNADDLITDLQMLGFIQSLSPAAGRVELSSLGRFSKAALG